MANTSDSLERCRVHIRLLAEFGKRALSDCDPATLLQEASELVVKGTGTRHAKVLQYRPDQGDLLVVSGVGWRPGVVGSATLPATLDSPPGRSFRTGETVYIPDLPDSSEFKYSELLREHGIVSLLNVPIEFERDAWGVLEVDSAAAGAIAPDDEPLLAGLANVLAAAIRQRRIAAEREAISLDREVMLHERDVLFRELHHRVNNNFHAIAGLIEHEANRAPPEVSASFERIAQRMAKTIEAHEHLAVQDVERDIALGCYLKGLIQALHGPENVNLVHRIAEANVPLRIAVRLGMIVNEMVTNSLKHAFDPSRGGTIEIMLDVDCKSASGRLVVADDGRGLPPNTNPRRGSGLELLEALASQIGGTMERSNRQSGGVLRVVTFPLEDGGGEA